MAGMSVNNKGGSTTKRNRLINSVVRKMGISLSLSQLEHVLTLSVNFSALLFAAEDLVFTLQKGGKIYKMTHSILKRFMSERVEDPQDCTLVFFYQDKVQQQTPSDSNTQLATFTTTKTDSPAVKSLFRSMKALEWGTRIFTGEARAFWHVVILV